MPKCIGRKVGIILAWGKLCLRGEMSQEGNVSGMRWGMKRGGRKKIEMTDELVL